MKALDPFQSASGGYRGHIAELDALHAIGIGFVLIDHFWPKPLSPLILRVGTLGGLIAMDSFFVLSGFLITGILLDTRHRPDYFRNYYIRRSLRIFPLYYLLLLALFVMTHVSHGGNGTEYTQMVHQWGSPAWFTFYLGNFRMAYTGQFPPVTAYGPLWSLQIEEQFYLLLPFAIRWIRPDRLSRWLWLMVFLSPVFRLLFFLWHPKNYFFQLALLPCRMDGLALGGIIALRFRRGPWKLSKAGLASLGVGLLALTVVGTNWSLAAVAAAKSESNPFMQLAGSSLSSLGCACLVLWLIFSRGSRYTRVLRIAPLLYIGKVSYGLYLLHQLSPRGLRLVRKLGVHLNPNGLSYFIVLVCMSLAMASLSWYLMERPLLSLKDRLAPSRENSRVPAVLVSTTTLINSSWPRARGQRLAAGWAPSPRDVPSSFPCAGCVSRRDAGPPRAR
jgi:peptidoglycan/LPS O-acetylase OafA/YrhL